MMSKDCIQRKRHLNEREKEMRENYKDPAALNDDIVSAIKKESRTTLR